MLTAADRQEYSFSSSGDYATYIQDMDDGTSRLIVRDIDYGYETWAEVKYPDAPQICSSGIDSLFSDVPRVAVRNGSYELDVFWFRDGFLDGERMTKLCSITTKQNITGYAWSPDGGRILVWTYGTLSVYDADDGTQLATIEGEEGGFSAGGRMIYAADDGHLKLYDGATYELVYSFDGADETLLDRSQSLYFQQILRRFSPDGSLIAYPALDGRLRLYSCETGEIVHILSVPAVSLTWADWSFGGDKILAVGGGKTYVFSAKSGELLQTLASDGGTAKAFFVNGSNTVCTIALREISFWGSAPGDSLFIGDDKSTEFTFSKSGDYLYHLRSFPAYTAYAVDAGTGETVKYFGQCIWFQETQDGKTLAVYRPENDIDLYRVGQWDAPYKTLHYDGGRDDYYFFYHTPLGGMSFSPDGETLAVVNHVWGKIVLFDVKTGVSETLLAGDDFKKHFDSYGIGLNHVTICWNPDGTKITAVYTDPYLNYYRGGVRIHVKTGAVEEIAASIHYEQSPDHRYYLKQDIDNKTLRVYGAASEKLLYTLKNCDWACFGYGGLLLTTDGEAQRTTVRRASDGGAISSFEERAKPGSSPYSWYKTSFDGIYIAVMSGNTSERYAHIRLAATGEIIQEIPDANHIIWSPADSRFAVDLSGTALHSSISYITRMEDLETAVKIALERLNGRTLTEGEREQYWLD